MKYSKYVVLIIVILIAVGSALSFMTFSGDSSEKEIIELLNSFQKATANGDEKQLENLLDVQLEIVTNGHKESLSQKEYISLLKIGMQNVSSIETNFLTVSVSKDEAIAKCFLKINWNSERESPTEHLGDYTFIFKKRENVWKIVSIELQK